VARVREALQRIGQNPEMCRIIRGDVRRALVRGYPYAVLYRVRPDRVEVIAIFHGRRDPSVWQRGA
jgi:plasmid stabilization system protein ParE